jgi:heat shock protein HslJ
MHRSRGELWTACVLILLLVRAGAAAPPAADGGGTTAGRSSKARVSRGSSVTKRSSRRGRRGKAQAGEVEEEEEAQDMDLDLDTGTARGKKGAPAPAALPATPLDGTRWLVESYRGGDGQPATPVEGSKLTAQFQPGRIITGSAGCNDFTAGYTWDAGELTVSHAAATRNACPKPLTEQEEAYLSALHHAAGFTRNDQGLVLEDLRGAPVVTFRREPPPVLTGPVWRMTAYNDNRGGFPSARRDVSVTAVFGADGQLTGSGGCNDYRAKYRQDGNDLTLSPIILLTKKPCAGEIRDQERTFLAMLQSANRVEAEGSQLLLTRQGGTRIAVFAPEPAPGAPAGGQAAEAGQPPPR